MTIEIFNFMDIHILSIAIIATVLIYGIANGETKTHQQKIFILILWATIIAICTEFPRILKLSKFYYLAYWSEGLSYAITPAIAYLWVLYVYKTVNAEPVNFKKFAMITAIPILINASLILINPWTNMNYRLDRDLVLLRGPFYYVLVAAAAFYMILSLVLIIKYRHTTGKNPTKILIMFAILPIIGAGFQTMIYGINSLWISLSIGVLMLYLNIQNKVLNIDYLTQANNRKSFEQYLSSKIENRSNDNFSVFMLDIDEFKEINDTQGHHVGDEALKRTVEILQKTFGPDAFVARVGGDEFIVITDDIVITSDAISMIENELSIFNTTSGVYKLSFSIGGHIYEPSSGVKTEELMKILDAKMYEAKRKKAFKRRKIDLQ